MLLKPQEHAIVGMDGVSRIYILSKIPFMDSKEIVTQYPTSLLPKIGDYVIHERMVLKLMSYVGIPQDKTAPLQLTTRALIDNHIPDFRTGIAVERAMAEYNWGFFLQDDLSNFWVRVKMEFSQFIQKILMDSLQQSSLKEKPPSTN